MRTPIKRKKSNRTVSDTQWRDGFMRGAAAQSLQPWEETKASSPLGIAIRDAPCKQLFQERLRLGHLPGRHER